MFTASVASAPDAIEKVAAFVQTATGNFARALKLGFFWPASFVWSDVRTSETGAEIDLVAANMQPGLLRILWGMCEYGRIREQLPLKWCGVRENDIPVHIDMLELPVKAAAEHPYLLSRPPFIGNGEQLVILVECAARIDEQQRERIEAGFDTWEAMLMGGFPPPKSNPGESVVGATSSHLISPTTYQWFAEGMAVDNSSLEALLIFLDMHARMLAIRHVDVEM